MAVGVICLLSVSVSWGWWTLQWETPPRLRGFRLNQSQLGGGSVPPSHSGARVFISCLSCHPSRGKGGRSCSGNYMVPPSSATYPCHSTLIGQCQSHGPNPPREQVCPMPRHICYTVTHSHTSYFSRQVATALFLSAVSLPRVIPWHMIGAQECLLNECMTFPRFSPWCIKQSVMCAYCVPNAVLDDTPMTAPLILFWSKYY